MTVMAKPRTTSLVSSEREWQTEVERLAKRMGWRSWHFNDSRKQVGNKLVGDKDARGWPDLSMAHPRHGLIFAELKVDARSKPSAAQKETAACLAAAVGAILGKDTMDGARILVHLWRPEDLATVVLPALRGRPTPMLFGW